MSMDQSYMWHSYVYHFTPSVYIYFQICFGKTLRYNHNTTLACCEREVVIALYLYKNKVPVTVKCWLIFVHQSVLSS